MDKVAKATLRYLFKEYLKAPSVPYTINSVTDQYKADAVKVSHYLLEQKWIRERWVHQNQLVTCRITVSGIEEIDPSFIDFKLKRLATGLISSGGIKSLADIFDSELNEYAIALDLVYQLQKLGLVLMLHRNGSIVIELTGEGWKYFQKNQKPLYSLMSVA
jgi:hypothetical protein